VIAGASLTLVTVTAIAGGRERTVGDLDLHVVDVVRVPRRRAPRSPAPREAQAPVLGVIEKRAASAPPAIE
jgi:hypothetical protein